MELCEWNKCLVISSTWLVPDHSKSLIHVRYLKLNGCWKKNCWYAVTGVCGWWGFCQVSWYCIYKCGVAGIRGGSSFCLTGGWKLGKIIFHCSAGWEKPAPSIFLLCKGFLSQSKAYWALFVHKHASHQCDVWSPSSDCLVLKAPTINLWRRKSVCPPLLISF